MNYINEDSSCLTILHCNRLNQRITRLYSLELKEESSRLKLKPNGSQSPVDG